MKPNSTLRSFLALAGSSLLAMSSANALTYYWDGTSATWNDVANWSTDAGATTPDPGALPMVTDDLIFNITGLNTAQNITLDADQAARSLTFNTTGTTNIRGNSSGTDARALTLGIGGITLASGAGAVTIGEAPGTYGAVNITLGANQTWTNSSSSLLTVNSDIDLSGRTLTMGANQHISGNITGTGTLTLSALTTRRILSGTNSFTSNLAIQSAGSSNVGILAITSIADSTENSSLGKNNTITLGAGSASAGRLEYIGTATSSSNRTFIMGGTGNASAQIHNNGTGVLTFTAATLVSPTATGTRNFILGGSNTGDNEIQGGINNGSGVVNLSKTGTGTWILSGNNTYGGDTAVSGGKLVLSGVNSYTGTTTVSGLGELVLSGDTSSVAGATSVSGGGKLVLDYTTDYANDSKIGNTTLTLNGGNLVLRGGSHAQAVTSISFNGNNYSSISRESGTATLLNAGALQASGAGNTSSTLSISAGGIVTTTSANTSGILSAGKITIGSDFAFKDVGDLVNVYAGYTTLLVGSGSGNIALTNLLTGGGATNSSKSSYALKIVNFANDDVLTLGDGHDLIISNSATLLYAGGSNNNYTIDGSATSDVRTSNNSVPLFMNIVSGATLTVNTKMSTGAGGSGNSLVKTGAGTLVAGGASVYTSSTIIQQGVFRLANDAGLGTTGSGTSVQIGSALELSQTTGGSPADITVGAEALTLNGTGISDGGALRNHSGNNTYGGLITLGSSARINSNASTSLTLTGGIDTAGRNVTFGGAGNTTVSTAAISGAGGLIKDGAGTTTLSAGVTHSYTGTTTVSAGKLLVDGSTDVASAVTVTAGTATGTPLARLGGTGTIGGNVSLTTESASGFKNGGVLAPTAAASGTALDVTGTTTFNTGSLFEWNMSATTPGTDPGVVSNSGSYGQLAGTGAISGSNAVFNIALGAGNAFSDAFWNSDKSWTNVFTGAGATNTLASIFASFGGSGVDSAGVVSGEGYFSFTGTSTLNWTYSAIPEPTSALAGLLLGAGLLRRRRA